MTRVHVISHFYHQTLLRLFTYFLSFRQEVGLHAEVFLERPMFWSMLDSGLLVI